MKRMFRITLIGLALAMLVISGILQGPYLINTYFSQDTGLNVPDDMKLTISYTSGQRDENKRSQVNYFDSSGNLLTYDILSNSSDSGAFNRHNEVYQYFTIGDMYSFDGTSHTVSNHEMKTKYADVAMHNEQVLESGYIEGIDMFYKRIAAGYDPDVSDDYFSLLTFYNNEEIVNIEIPSLLPLALDEKAGTIYALRDDGIGLDKLPLDDVREQEFMRIAYDAHKADFITTSTAADLLPFVQTIRTDYKLDDDVDIYASYDAMFINKGVLYQSVIVSWEDIDAAANSGEDAIDDLELSKNTTAYYLIEYSIENLEEPLSFIGAYEIDLASTDGLNLKPYMFTDEELKVYSQAYPSKIISFNLATKQFSYQNFLDDIFENENMDAEVRIINGAVYVLEVNLKDEAFELFKMDDSDKMESIMKGKTPPCKMFAVPGAYWLADFWVDVKS